MDVKISTIADQGDPKKERLVLKVLVDTNIGSYAVFRAFTRGETLTNYVKSTFWFPDQKVKADDLVVLYTRSGTPATKLLESGKTAHFFYWSEPESIWDAKVDAVVLVLLEEWASRMPSKQK